MTSSMVSFSSLSDAASAMLVIGSSLMVFSGYRFCRRAHSKNMPIYAINRGNTRADDELSLKIDFDCGEALEALLDRLGLH